MLGRAMLTTVRSMTIMSWAQSSFRGTMLRSRWPDRSPTCLERAIIYSEDPSGKLYGGYLRFATRAGENAMRATGSDTQPRAERGMRADARRNYERLLSAAAAAFAEHGADDVSLEEIARRAGVGIGTLYRHFPTRQALLEAVYRDQVDLLSRRAEKLLGAESPGDALADWLRALVKFSSTKRSLTTALLATLGKDSDLLSSCGQRI